MRKIAFSILLVLLTINLHAKPEKNKVESGKNGANFQDVKSLALENLEKRIKHLQDTKTCVSKAKDPKSFKTCSLESRKKGSMLRRELKDQRKKR